MEVRDIVHVLQDSLHPLSVNKHVDLDVACASCRNGAVITQDHFGVLGEGSEMSEPGSM